MNRDEQNAKTKTRRSRKIGKYQIKKAEKRHSKADLSRTELKSGRNIQNNSSSNTLNGFKTAIRAFEFSDNSCVSDSEQSNMSNRIKVLCSIKYAPKDVPDQSA